MLKRIWEGKQESNISSIRPFQPYSLFGDPAHRFAAIPPDYCSRWALTETDPGLLRMVLGMAWLNHLPVRIITSSAHQGQLATRIAREAESWIQEMLDQENMDVQTKNSESFPNTLATWQSTSKAFNNSLKTIQQTKFGSINALEVAHTLLRLYPSLDSHPFHWYDGISLSYTPEELQEIMTTLDKASPKYQALLQRNLLTRLDINPLALSNWTAGTLRTALQDHIHQLDELIRMYEKCLFHLNQHLKQTLNLKGNQSNKNLLQRLTMGTLDPDALASSRLPHWHQSYQLFEHDLLSTGWFAAYKGMQAISLEETSRELNLLFQRLMVLDHDLEPVLEAATAYAWLQEQPSAIRKLLNASIRLLSSNNQDSVTFWYLFSWLEQAVPADLWQSLEETEMHKNLSRQLPKQALLWYKSGFTPTAQKGAKWSILEGVPEMETEPGSLDLYWGMTPHESMTDLFHFHVLEEPHTPMEYARLCQVLDQEPWADYNALPYPLCGMSELWEGVPARWHESAFHGSEGITVSV